MILKVLLNKPTGKQLIFIEQLLIDCYLTERVKRNGQLSHILNRPIKYLDDIQGAEASKVIDYLKELKERINQNDTRSTDSTRFG